MADAPTAVVVGVRRSTSLNAGVPGDEVDLAAAEKLGPMGELGATGLKYAGGVLDEEFLPQLRGRKAIEVYREMADNDPIVGALLFAIEMLIRNVSWRVDPGGKSADDTKAAEFLDSCRTDMSHTWDDLVAEALSMLTYGWAWHEVVYKRRVGPWEKDPTRRSMHTDGLIGWRKMPIRAQDTLQRWIFDDSNDVQGMVQQPPPDYQARTIPLSRSALFRNRAHKGSPEGRSMLRNAYRPWFLKKRMEEFESVGVERDLNGMPVAHVPAAMLRAKPGSPQYESLQGFKKMVKGVRRNEQEGLVFPLDYDQETKQPLYKLELLGGGGARAFDTSRIIDRYNQQILMTVLADFIMVGHQQTGSYSMHVDKTGIFRTSLNAICDQIADVLNRHVVPKLFLVNGWKPATLPKIVHDDVDAPDIAVLAQFMSALQAQGITWFPDPTLENFLREAARLPKLDEDQEELRRQMQARSEATQFAQANADYLATQNLVTQTLSGQIPGQEQPGQQNAPGQPGQQPGQKPGQKPASAPSSASPSKSKDPR
jgi:hypothetical protein